MNLTDPLISGAGRPTPLGEEEVFHAWATVCHVFFLANLRKMFDIVRHGS
jgi:hypothetical protein